VSAFLAGAWVFVYTPCLLSFLSHRTCYVKAVTVDSLSGFLFFLWVGLVELTPVMLALDIMQSLRGTIKSGVVYLMERFACFQETSHSWLGAVFMLHVLQLDCNMSCHG